MKDILANSNPLYRKYTAKDKKLILKEFPYGWNQIFELKCCMDSNIDVEYITDINVKSYTMSAYRELVYLNFPISIIKQILNPNFSESKVNILIKCIKKHLDISTLINRDYIYIKNYYNKNNNF